MRLTKKKAIEISIELWTWLAETGRRKSGWLGWKKYGEMEGNCPLCEYSEQVESRNKSIEYCGACPLTPSCYDYHYKDWEGATTKKDHRKYASQFLEQLRSLK